MAIHPTAIVEDGALLGAGVEIGPFCVVGPEVRLGDGVRLLSHVVIGGRTEIGARTLVHAGAVLGGESQIRGNDAEGTRLVVGEDNVIREYVTFSLGSAKGHGVTVIGARGFFMAYSHVGHDCRVGNDVTFANGVQLGGHVDIADGVNIGGLSAVQQFGRIGRGAMLGGVAGCNEDIIPFGIAFGSHTRLAGLNIVGLKRRGVPRGNIHALRATYRLIFLETAGKFEDRVARARDNWPDVAEVREVVDFIRAPAKRPICRARLRGRDAADEA
ncbi:MAG: acyl-ACP--UDP-N-acetylglucosamine O-acyltransferase [Alphaproteobacteria bacterium]|nr:acyl-ACP--UDP-N-acetylglucosamine O-acyltransferase [Alphaproteobacteria bacterium]MDE2111768.1 acyl-ACP--UDP-N-acetylglucosamine O-acyltransferase [Alphaproteobacteria bacterium]MDE2494028.1 acyl-ACP--UDP-N-acetylglucosamine O-acyltransferase [Alphaproteobacteria bacterium]